ncbi:MAG: hypothetical protein QOJ51_4647 [Acidobacteriaceae bacterium]|jgi:hypothetical protein|nr:hypothetical protein [Acidobacteriaceae bacterium]
MMLHAQGVFQGHLILFDVLRLSFAWVLSAVGRYRRWRTHRSCHLCHESSADPSFLSYRVRQTLCQTDKTWCSSRCEESENIFFIFSAKTCPHPHMTNHGSCKRWRQLLGKAVTSATIRVEFTLTHVRLFRTVGFRRRFSSTSTRLRRWWRLSESHCCTYDRSHKGQLLQYAPRHFDPPFQMAGKRNRYVTVVSQIFSLPVLANCRE